MSDIDIAAIRRNAISPGLHSEANSVYWWKACQALLDAYEAKDSLLRVALADADAWRVARDDAHRAYEDAEARADELAARYEVQELVKNQEIQGWIDRLRTALDVAEADADQLATELDNHGHGHAGYTTHGWRDPGVLKALDRHRTAKATRDPNADQPR